jgi:ribosomal protein L11 methyltransferase
MTNETNNHEWVALQVTLRSDMADLVCSFFHDEDSRGVVIDERPDEQVTVTAYFRTESYQLVRDRLLHYLIHLAELFPDVAEPEVHTTPVKRENWATAWQSNFKPLAIGRNLLVTPPWITPSAADRLVIIIEPAEAFGTGTHETTQGCLELLEEAMAEFSRGTASVLDAGCGSGILAIAAVKLGARSTRAVDDDPVAVAATRKNAELNKVEDSITAYCTPLDKVKDPADIVAANLDPKTLAQHVEHLLRLSRRYLIISGVPADQWDRVKESFVSNGLRLRREIVRHEWGSGMFLP